MSDFEPISIEIEASASKANSELDKVDQALGRIQTSIGEISKMLNGISGKGSSLSSSMRTLASAINGINPNNIKEVSKSVDSMASSSERAEKKVKTISSSVNELNSNLSKTNQASTSFEKMLPALAQANDYMSAFNSWAERCFRKDLGIGLFGQQLREIPQIMQEITASNGVEVITGQFEQITPAIEQATNGLISFDRWVEDAFKKDLGINGIAKEFDILRNSFSSNFILLESFGEQIEETAQKYSQAMGDIAYETEMFSDEAKTDMSNLPMVIEQQFMGTFEKISSEYQRLKSEFVDGFGVDMGEERIMPEYTAPIDTPTWTEALNQVKAFYDQYEKLKDVMGEADAEMQTATNIVNTLNRAFSMTKAGQMSWDTARMKEATAILQEMQDKIDRVQASFKDQNLLEGNSAPKLETWKTVFEDIDGIQNSFNGLTQKIGEANAEMSNLVDIRNRLNKAFSDTESGKLPWDNESMQRAYQMLDDVNDKINRVKRNLKDPNKLEVEVDPTGELEKLYARLKEVQSLISDMKNNKINFSTEDMRSALKEQETITKRIAELEGRDKKKDDTGWMAQLIAIQHELEKASQMFDKFGNIAKKAFLKALTPLKLFKHEFEEIKGLITSVSRIGSAFAMISKPITKIFKNFQNSAQKAFSKIQKAWAKVMRTFTFMLIRKAITAILTNINNAITSLAKFSKTVDGKFNETMSLLTSDFRYLGASLVAAFAPILNYVVPIIDRLVESLVEVINKINVFFAVLTKSKTYTIAKKKIVDYTDAMEDANKKAKQLTLGIDELNILSEDTSSKKDEEDMFDWVTLPTPSIDIPDWLKWLKGLWDKLWEAIKKMLKALWDAIKEAWNRAGEYLKNALKHFLESLVGLITDIIRDLTRLFNTEKFKEFLARLIRIAAKIVEFISIIIDKIREAWNYNELGYQILEAILDILDTIATHVENILDLMIAWAHSITFVPLFEAVLAVLKQINYAVDQIGYVAEDVAGIVLDILKLVIEDYAPRLLRVIGDIIEGIGNIAKKLHEAFIETDFRERFVAAFDGIVQAIIPHLEEVGAYFAVWASQLDFKPLLNSIIKLFESLKPVADFVGGVFADLVEHYILPTAKHIVEKIVPQIAEAIAHFADAVDWGKLRKNIDKLIKSFEHLTASIGEGVAKAMDKLGQALAKFVNSDRFTAFVDYIEKFAHKIDGNMIAKVLEAIGVAILKLADAVMKFTMSDTVQNFLDGLIKFVNTTSVDKLADILIGIAKAFLMFKGLSFLTETASHISGLLVPIGKLILSFGTGGALAVALAAGATAFLLFHKQIAAIDWKGVIEGIESAILNGINAIDWQGVGEALAHVLGATIPLALKSPAFVLALTFGFVGAVVEAVQGIGDAVADAVKNAFHSIGVYAIDGLIDGIKAGWDAFWGFWAGLFDKLVWIVKKILGINSPSTVMYAIGWDTIQGLLNGIAEKWKEFWAWISGLWNDFVLWVKGIWQSVVNGILEAWQGFTEKISEIWQTIKDWFSQTWSDFKLWCLETWGEIVQGIINAWQDFTSKISEIWEDFKKYIEKAWNDFAQWCAELWQSIRDTIREAWETVWSKTEELWNKIKAKLEEVWNWLKNTAKSIFNNAKQTIIDVWEAIKKKTEEVWNYITNFLKNLWNNLKSTAEEIWNAICEFIHNLWDQIQEKWESVWTSIINAIKKIWEDFKNSIGGIWDSVVQFFEKLWDGIQGIWVKIWNGIVTAVQTIWKNFVKSVEDIWGNVSQFLKDVWNDVQKAWETVWTNIGDFIKKTINGILKFVGGMINTVVECINTVIDAINNVNFHFTPPDWAQEMLGISSLDIGFSIPKVPKVNIPQFASGGFPEDGWFRASQGEIMGRFDNGKSVVANNDQITDGIARAVSSSLVPILNDIAQSNNVIASKDTVLQVDSREIAKANSKGQTKLGRSLISFD